MKIAFVTKTLKVGGAASGANNLLAALKTTGAEIKVFSAYESINFRSALARSAERALERALFDPEVHCLKFGGPHFDLDLIYREFRPDLIQMCDVSGNTIQFSQLSRLPCPVVHRMSDFWPYHGARHYAEAPPIKSSLPEQLLKWRIFDGSSVPTARVAPSHWLAERLQRHLTEDNIAVILNAVTMPSDIRPRILRKDALHLGFISNAIEDQRKGFPTLPRLLSALAKDLNVPIVLHLFGKSKSPIIISGVNVCLHGPFVRSKQALREVYNAFDILLCPSKSDNSPNVVTEALAHGVPVIAQYGTGLNSYLSENHGKLINYWGKTTGTLEFLSAIHDLCSHYNEASVAALSYVEQNLTPEIIGEEYMKLYSRLFSNY